MINARPLIFRFLLSDMMKPFAAPWIDTKALRYEESTGVVRLTRSGLGFEGVAPEVWRYRIGSYPVLERWLRARTGQLLTVQSIREFRWMAEAVRLSFIVQQRIQEDGSR